MDILKRLRDIQPESFESLYSFMCDFTDYLQELLREKKDGKNYSADDLIDLVVTKIYSATPKDQIQAKKLFENLSFQNYSAIRDNLGFTCVTLQTAFSALEQIKANGRKAILIDKSNDKKYQEFLENLANFDKNSIDINSAAAAMPLVSPIKLNKEQQRLNAAIASIGDYGLKLYNQDEKLAKKKGEILFELAVNLRGHADSQNQLNNLSKHDFNSQLISTIDDYFDKNNNSEILSSHRDPWKKYMAHYCKTLILTVLTGGIYLCYQKCQTNSFFPPAKTESVEKLDDFRQSIVAKLTCS